MGWHIFAFAAFVDADTDADADVFFAGAGANAIVDRLVANLHFADKPIYVGWHI